MLKGRGNEEHPRKNSFSGKESGSVPVRRRNGTSVRADFIRTMKRKNALLMRERDKYLGRRVTST